MSEEIDDDVFLAYLTFLKFRGKVCDTYNWGKFRVIKISGFDGEYKMETEITQNQHGALYFGDFKWGIIRKTNQQ